jgi:GTP pyrophosphokinase
MNELLIHTDDEKREIGELTEILIQNIEGGILSEAYTYIKERTVNAIAEGKIMRDALGFSPVITDMQTAVLVGHEIGFQNEIITSILLNRCVNAGTATIEEIKDIFGENVTKILNNLIQINSLYAKSPTIESENFRNLLLSFTNDMRVILIMIASRLVMLRGLFDSDNEEARRLVANEASKLYIPLAHKLGFYKLKSEMEDLSLRYTETEIYAELSRKLEETAASREDYIASFIKPIERQLKMQPHIKFRIKGRTKSINSIWQKMKKQQCSFEQIYDLFAIRIIIDSEPKNEKSECWQVYSIVADMYTPNPHRLRDWLSVPKSNGYESLHTTVMGPGGKWVEVQIRTERMDVVAEKGLAAHFKYKGVKGETDFDMWLANVREVLENPETSSVDYIDDFKLNLYNKEVFVFTPKGDLFKLPKGATVLDFAFQIHSNLGARCVGARINGKNATIRQVLSNGDQVEVLSSQSQKPRKEWLSIVNTTKAKTKIKQILREEEAANLELGKELLKRRLKNWKIEYDETLITKLAKKIGYKTTTDFFQDLADERLDLQKVKELYLDIEKRGSQVAETEVRSAEGFEHVSDLEEKSGRDDVLIIDHLRGVEYSLAKCCNPIFGDEIFGFISARGGIKIHKSDCPNAPQMMSRFGYRFVKALWTGKSDSLYACTLRVVGNDDIGIVTNITSLIQKESNVTTRSISVDSVDGLFQGNITVMVNDTKALNGLVKKIKAVKGVKSVERV